MSFTAPEPYQAIRILGRGGMGEVWEVEHLETGLHYALKRVLGLDFEDGLRFQREAEVMASLQSPYVVRVHSAGVHQGSPYLIQELLRGGSLADRLRAGPLPPGEARRVAADIAEGVVAAHRLGVLHRDLKPDNVLFSEDGSAKVADFGLARALNDTSERLTQTGEVLGTPAYMAPEQAEDSSRCDVPADVYALGAILYALLTGVSPIPLQGRTALAALVAIQREVPLPPRERQPGIPADLNDLCLAALTKDPRERIQSAAEFLARLQGAPPPAAIPWLKLIGGGILAIAVAAAVGAGLVNRPVVTVRPSAASRPPATPSPTRAKLRRRTEAYDLRFSAGRGLPLLGVAHGGEFWIAGGGTLTRWDAASGQLLETQKVLPRTWSSRLLLSLPDGSIFLTGRNPPRQAWWSRGAVTISPVREGPSAVTLRAGAGFIVGDQEGGLTFYDGVGQSAGERIPALAPGGLLTKKGKIFAPIEIRGLWQPRADRLVIVASPNALQLDTSFKGAVMPGWLIVVELKGTVLGELLDSKHIPGAKSLAFDPGTNALLIGKSVGSIDYWRLLDREGELNHLSAVRRNLCAVSPLSGDSTSFGVVEVTRDARYLIGMGSGLGPNQNLVVSCNLVEDPAEPKIVKLKLDQKPLSLAVDHGARMALVCGLDGLARLIPFEEFGIPEAE